MAYLGIDIGGSKIAAGLTEGNRILCEETLENKYFGCPDQMVEAIAQCVEKLETSCCKNAVNLRPWPQRKSPCRNTPSTK